MDSDTISVCSNASSTSKPRGCSYVFISISTPYPLPSKYTLITIKPVFNQIMIEEKCQGCVAAIETVNDDKSSRHLHAAVYIGPNTRVSKALLKRIKSKLYTSFQIDTTLQYAVKVEQARDKQAVLNYVTKDGNHIVFNTNDSSNKFNWFTGKISDIQSNSPKRKTKLSRGDRIQKIIDTAFDLLAINDFYVTHDLILIKPIKNLTNVYQLHKSSQSISERIAMELCKNKSFLPKEIEQAIMLIINEMKTKEILFIKKVDPDNQYDLSQIQSRVVDIDYTLMRGQDFALKLGDTRIITQNIKEIPTINYEPRLTLKNFKETITNFHNNIKHPWMDTTLKNDLKYANIISIIYHSIGNRLSEKQPCLAFGGLSNTAKSSYIIDLVVSLYPPELVFNLTQQANKFTASLLQLYKFLYSSEAAKLFSSTNEFIKQLTAGEDLQGEVKGSSGACIFGLNALPIFAFNLETIFQFTENEALTNRLHIVPMTHKYPNDDMDKTNKIKEILFKDRYIIFAYLYQVAAEYKGTAVQKFLNLPNKDMAQDQVIEDLKKIQLENTPNSFNKE